MRCEIDGIITAELPTVNGVTNSGKSFEQREYIIQDTDKYHKYMKFCMISFDGPIEQPLQVGEHVHVRLTVEARESKGKWFNDVKAYNVIRV
jgi:hypothetical protein